MQPDAPIPSIKSRRVWLGLLAAGLALLGWKFFTIENRPLHGDEAVQSVLLAQCLGEGHYAFNPQHFHGPLPHRLNALWLGTLGKHTYASLEAVDVRAGALLFGWLALGAVVVWAGRKDGRAGACAGLLFGLSPLAFYYNAIYFHENFLLFFALAAPGFAGWALHGGGKKAWALAGLCAGAMAATKSTWLLIAVSWVCALGAWWFLRKILPGWSGVKAQKNGLLAGLAVAAACAAACALAFYTDGFSRWQGAPDMVRTFFAYATDAGHNKPWNYYLSRILFFNGGFGEAAITLSALAGWISLFVSKNFRKNAPGGLLWLALAGAAQMVGYGMVPYKTPWLMLVPLAYLSPWAGWTIFYVGWAPEASRTRATAAIALLAAAAVFDARQIWASRPAAESRDGPAPFAYVPTSTDVPRMVAELLQRAPTGDIAVVADSEAIWPLPWYLRSAAQRTGYFYGKDVPPGDFAAYVFVNTLPDRATAETLRQGRTVSSGLLFLPGQPFAVYAPEKKP